MAANLTDSIIELRNQSLYAMFASPEGKALLATPRGIEFKALDEAIAKIGGAAILVRPTAASVVAQTKPRQSAPSASSRMSQTDYAAKALRGYGEPLPIGRLAEKTVEAGGAMGGANPIANFRSNLSRDKRFESIMRNGMYFWWFTGEDVPAGWRNEAAAPDLLAGAAASSDHSSQEGGGDHAVIIT